MDEVRTISVIPALCKLIEKIVLNKIEPFLYGESGRAISGDRTGTYAGIKAGYKKTEKVVPAPMPLEAAIKSDYSIV